MYKIYAAGELLCDSRVEELAILNPKIVLEANKAGTFKFTLPPGHPKYNAIAPRVTIIEVYRDGETEPTFEGICTNSQDDFYKQRAISCEGTLTFFNDSILRPAKRQGKTARGLLEEYIAQHNAQTDSFKHFQVGAVSVSASNLFRYTNYQSTMAEIKEDLLDDLGGFLRIRHANGVRYIDYLAESPNTNTQVIRLGENLIDFTSNLDTTALITGIIPLGKRLDESSIEGLEERLTIKSVNSGNDYLLNSTAAASLGQIFGVVTWDDITTPEELKQHGQDYLQKEQFNDVVIECQAVDLHLTDFNIEKFKILDSIRVVSTPHGLDRNFIITKLELNLNSPAKDKLTLTGSGKLTRATMSARTFQASKDILKKIEEIKPSEMLEQAKDNATQLIQTASNGFVTTKYDAQGRPTELLIMDTPSIETATKVWRWNVNGLGYSNTGYNGTYGLAMTMDGHFVADAITVEGLEVGKNVTMGEDAEISWEQVTSKPNDLAYTEDIPTKVTDLTDGNAYAKKTEVPTTVAELTDSGDYALIEYVDGKVPKKVSDLTDADLYALKTYVDGAFTELTPLYYLSTSKPSAPTSKVTSTATGANQWTTVLPTYINGYYYWTCNQSTTKGGTTSWTPVVMYTQSDVVTKITKDTVTTSYVNALNVTAGSVAAENITGTLISGKNYKVGDGDNQISISPNVMTFGQLCKIRFHGIVPSSGGSTTDWDVLQSYLGANGFSRTYIYGDSLYLDTDSSNPAAGVFANGLIYSGGRRVIYSANNSIYSFESANSYLQVTTSGGAYGVSWWSSDSRFKDNIEDTEKTATDIINKIQHRQFDWKDGRGHVPLGYVADELMEVIPEAVFEVPQPNGDSNKQIDGNIIIPYLTKALQESNEKVVQLEQRIEQLEKLVAEMKGE